MNFGTAFARARIELVTIICAAGMTIHFCKS
jgi:hypothetical protein